MTLKQHHEAIARGARCTDCPLYGGGQGPVRGEIRPGAKLSVVGEAPGTTEVEQGRPFVGASGMVLDEALAEGGIERKHASYTNAILCRPPGGNMMTYLVDLKRAHAKQTKQAKAAKKAAPAPLHTPQDCCAPRLARDLEESGARTILAVGGEALKACAQHLKLPYGSQRAAPGEPRVSTIKRQHGSPVVTRDGRILATSLHPAFAMHGSATFMPVIREDLARAARIALRGGIEWSEPSFILKPSADVCINVMDRMRASGARVTVDIETNSANVMTADIRCVGLGAVVDGKELVIVVPIKRMDGATWWSPGVEMQVKRALTALLEAAPLAGHNLLFDTAVLLQHRLLESRGKLWFDTLLAHHDTSHSELPHDLGFVAGRFFEAPRWKEDADQKSVDGVDDYWLHLYCAKDVLGEMRLVAPLAAKVNHENMTGALATDLQLAPIARDMGMLGLNIDEVSRRRFFDTLEKTGAERAAAIRRIVGNPNFNPNAVKQISRWLFVDKGLSPPYATDGREWGELAEDDENPIDTDDPEIVLAKASTNELSLLALLDLGVDEQTRAFVETLLSYRGIEKVRGTYVGLSRGEDGQVVDTHRQRGFIQTENWGKGLENLSILHPSWKLHVVPTGRWATSPNCQNWPERVVYDTDLYKATDGKDGILNTRRMVQAPPGYTLVGADYAAIELRLYAIMAQDKLLLDAIYNGRDPHCLNYATMQARAPSEIDKWYERVDKSPPKVRKYLRLIAKRFGFLCIYGGQKNKLYKTMAGDRNPDGSRAFPDLKPADVELWFDNWHRTHPETRRWHEAVVRAWSEHGFVGTIIDGRKRFFIGGLDMTAMPNMTIQGSAASIANRAMLRVAAACPHRGWGPLAGPVLQVHDFIGLQVPIDRQQEAESLLMAEMPYEHGGMKFEVEQKSGPSWDQT